MKPGPSAVRHALACRDAGGDVERRGPLWASFVAIRSYRCMSDEAQGIDGAARDAHKGPHLSAHPPASLHRRWPRLVTRFGRPKSSAYTRGGTLWKRTMSEPNA